jgi:hypothetical protein
MKRTAAQIAEAARERVLRARTRGCTLRVRLAARAARAALKEIL